MRLQQKFLFHITKGADVKCDHHKIWTCDVRACDAKKGSQLTLCNFALTMIVQPSSMCIMGPCIMWKGLFFNKLTSSCEHN